MVDRMGPIQERDRSPAVAIVSYMAGFSGSTHSRLPFGAKESLACIYPLIELCPNDPHPFDCWLYQYDYLPLDCSDIL
jgi:hypothetical protein